MINFILGFCVAHTAMTLLAQTLGAFPAALVAVIFSAATFSALEKEKANAVKEAVEKAKES